MSATLWETNLPDLPPAVDIRTEIYRDLPTTVQTLDWDKVDAASAAIKLLPEFSDALSRRDTHALASIFCPGDSYWRDTLALTAHLRTFTGRDDIIPTLVRLSESRGVCDIALKPGSSQVLSLNEKTKWLSLGFTFRTAQPKALCEGVMMLLPEVSHESPAWKVWSLTTWMLDFEQYPEDTSLLRCTPEPIGPEETLSTSVLIVGSGNSGLILGARLKARAVDFIIIERNSKIGDNWQQRYDCLRFHLGKSFCETPYLQYPKEASDPCLTRDELAEQMRLFSREFSLEPRVLHETTIKSTSFDDEKKVWTARLICRGAERTVTCSCLVLANGAGFAGTFVPDLPGSTEYKGAVMHSDNYRSAKSLAQQGAKSAIVIGSANTAFDIVEDCYNAGLETTMIQRSPTYVVPLSYLLHPQGLGMYDYIPAEMGDALLHATPLAVGGQLVRSLHAGLAEAEPDRYKDAIAAGFRLMDSTQADLVDHLFRRCGGHFVDMGTGMQLIATKKIGIKSGAVPASYTTTGLKLSDETTLDADAVVWCTGFRSLDARHNLGEALGVGAEAIAGKLEPTWGVDAEGEIRGLWKRHEGVENFWIFAGGTANHRWYSGVIALQIKGILEGVLPEAYRSRA